MKPTLNLKNVVVEHRAIRREAVTLHLPMPVSVNNLYLNVRRRGRVPTLAYKVWRGLALEEWSAQPRRYVTGPVEIIITLHEPKRARDLDNCSKCLIDFLVEHRVIEADDNSIVRELTLRWGGDAGALVKIIPHCPADRARAA